MHEKTCHMQRSFVCNLRRVDDEKNLLLVYPNTQKIKEHFYKLMPTTNMIALPKFVACYQGDRDLPFV